MADDYDDARPPRAGMLEAENAELRARVAELEAALSDGSFYKESTIDALMDRADGAEALNAQLLAKLAAARDDVLEEAANVTFVVAGITYLMPRELAAAIRNLKGGARSAKINWARDPDAVVEDDEPQIGRDYA